MAEMKGNRWVGQEPTPDEVKTWFEAISLHDGLEHSDYLGGITLVSATEKVPTLNERGAIIRQDQPIFTPYPKVETRVKYFTDLMLHKEDEWVGLIKAIPVDQQEGGQNVPSSLGLTEGFYYTGVKTEKGIAVFIVYSVRASVYRRADLDGKAPTEDSLALLQGVGTKQVPVLRYPDRADENAMMKAQTGAVGRALGMIGMLVLPGAGVATADDVEESQATEDRGGAASTPPGEQAEEAPVDEAKLRADATADLTILKDDFPAKWEEIQEWSRERHFARLSEISGPALKGFVRKVRKAVEDAQGAQEARAAAEGAPDVPLAAQEPEDGAEEAPDGSA